MLIFFGHGVIFILFIKVCIVMDTTLGKCQVSYSRIGVDLEMYTYHPSDDSSL
jgi:hypothetical protein